MLRTFKIAVDGRPYTVTVEEVTDGPGIFIPRPGDMTVPQPAPPAAPAAPAAPVAPTAPAAPAAPTAGEGDEVSPLAGVVVSIDVSVGQAVNEGDKVATIEAMKMKTIVAAKRAGSVSKIHVQAGDGVEPGQPLLTIA